MLPLKVKKWLNQFKQYYFTYSKGFYHLPYNGNSPQSLVDSFDKMPFVQHSKEKKCVSSNNPFCEGGFYYQQIEEGCWIIYSKIRYKANVAYDLMYNNFNGKKDESEDDSYYMLSLNNINNVVDCKDICEKFISFPKYSWTFFKPKVRNCDVNFKNASNKYITIYFNEAWLSKNLLPNQKFIESNFESFIMSQKDDYIIWSIPGSDATLNNFELFEKAMNVAGDAATIDFLHLKYCTLNFIFDFFNLCKEQNVIAEHIQIDYEDKFYMNKIESYLRKHLFGKFPGIAFLSGKFYISETKLKTEFKQLFGKPIFQYFNELQMQLAKELLSENQLTIKEISYKFNYENAGKFSTAFKKCHGILPSELRKN